MNGRLEHQIKTENALKQKAINAPDYMKRYLMSLSSKTHTTKMRYYNNVERFLRHKYGSLPAIDKIRQIDSYDIQVYMSEINYYGEEEIKELKGSTQCTIYSSLANFFRFLKINKYVNENPFVDGLIERPKIQENDIVYLTPDEVKRVELEILNGAGNHLSRSKQAAWKYRDFLLFRLPVVNGVRVMALSEINMQDIDFEGRRIKVVEKGNITKYVDFDYKTLQYLNIWYNQRRLLLCGKECDALFISNRRERMTVRAIENIISKYTQCIEGKHITPHKLRCTCGTNTYQVTGDIHLVSKILGHKNTSPTKRYAAVLNEDITNTINKVADLY